jgi:hypothetical protein
VVERSGPGHRRIRRDAGGDPGHRGRHHTSGRQPGQQRFFGDGKRDWRVAMEDWDKFRAVVVSRTEAAKRRRQMMARARAILLVVATLLLVAVLFVLVHDRMPALVGQLWSSAVQNI